LTPQTLARALAAQKLQSLRRKTRFDPDFDIDDWGMPHLEPILPRA
jgi:hypothetical protein